MLPALLAGAAGGVLGGWPGLLVVVAALGGSAVLARRWPDRRPPVPWASRCSRRSLAYALRPWGGDPGWAGSLGWPPYFVLVACVLPLGFCLADSRASRAGGARDAPPAGRGTSEARRLNATVRDQIVSPCPRKSSKPPGVITPCSTARWMQNVL